MDSSTGDPGRFIQADTIVPQPGHPQALNRYSYALNNPLKYVDPSGHVPYCEGEECRHNYPPSPPPWWMNVQIPSIHDVQAGGRYGVGVIQYGPQWLSLFLPPTVWSYTNKYGQPYLYDPNQTKTAIVPSNAYIHNACLSCDYLIGPGYEVVSMGDWTILTIQQHVEGPTPSEFWTGLAAGLANTSDSLLPGPLVYDKSFYQKNPPPLYFSAYSTRGDAAVNGFATLIQVGAGAAATVHQDTFILQQSTSGQYRLIVMTRQLSANQEYYVTFQGKVPVIWGATIGPRR